MGLAALVLVALAVPLALDQRAPRDFDRFVCALAAALGLQGFVAALLVDAPLLYAWIGIAALSLGVPLALAVVARRSALLDKLLPPIERTSSLPRPHGWFEWFCLAAVLLSLAIGVLHALAPPTGWDATVAHLALPKEYARAGHIFVANSNTYTGYPHLLHAHYALAYQLAGARGVGVIDLAWSALAVVTAFVLTRRLANDTAGFAAAAMAATAPLFTQQVGVASLDLAFGAVVTAAVALVMIARTARDPAMLLGLAGILAGYAYGIRHLGIVTGAILFVVLVLQRRPLAQLLAFGGAFASFVFLWMFRSWVFVGNPVYPFLQDWFPNAVLTNFPTGDIGGHESVGEWTLWGLLTFPIRLGLLPDQFDGVNASPGIFAVPFGLAALALGGKQVRIVASMGLAGIFILYGLQHYARYAWPFFVLLMGAGATQLAPPTRLAAALRAVVVSGVLFGLAFGAMGTVFKVPVVLGFESERDYLHRRVERYAAFEWVNENILHEDYDGPFLSLDIRGYYLDAIVFQNYAALILLQAVPVAEQAAWLRAQGIRHVLYPVAYVEESPGWVAMGFADQFRSWLEAPAYFALVHTLETPRRGGEGTETVHILAVRD